MHLSLSIFLGIATYLAIAWLLGMQELRILLLARRSKLRPLQIRIECRGVRLSSLVAPRRFTALRSGVPKEFGLARPCMGFEILATFCRANCYEKTGHQTNIGTVFLARVVLTIFLRTEIAP